MYNEYNYTIVHKKETHTYTIKEKNNLYKLIKNTLHIQIYNHPHKEPQVPKSLCDRYWL